MVGCYTRHLKSLRTWATTSLRAGSSCYYFYQRSTTLLQIQMLTPMTLRMEVSSTTCVILLLMPWPLRQREINHVTQQLDSWDKQYLFCYMVGNPITCTICIKNDRQGKGAYVSSKQLSMYQLTGLLYEKHNAISFCHITRIKEMSWGSPSRFYY